MRPKRGCLRRVVMVLGVFFLFDHFLIEPGSIICDPGLQELAFVALLSITLVALVKVISSYMR